MIAGYRMSVETRGGVCDLSRVVGMLAVYDLTPTSFTVESHGTGLRMEAFFSAGADASGLCAKRLATFPAVAHVAWEPVPPEGV